MNASSEQIVELGRLLKLRRSARRHLDDWARLNGFEPAQHHRLINSHLEAVVRGEIKRLIIMLPPGAAKSTYASVLFPPWYLAQKPAATILACSYAYTLIEGFGKRCRNLVRLHPHVLRYALSEDAQAAGNWETTSGGRYFCAGVSAGIAGHRADVGFIDDYIGSQADADSKLVRDSQWEWYKNDFLPRLKPHAAIVILATPRHEDDLIGRILAKEAAGWKVLRVPMLAEENDPLGRKPGERLWSEWYTADQVVEARRNSRTWATLYQVRPAPEEGDYFQRSWLKNYEPQDLPKNLRIYGAGDFAVSEEETANRTCFGLGGLDEAGVLWILPHVYWDYNIPEPPDKKIEGILNLCAEHEPLVVWGEKGHISKSLKPFIQMRMRERREYTYIEEVTPAHGKDVRARSIQARMSQGMVMFPYFAPWWPEAEHELLTFPGGRSDDFVDMMAHLGNGVAKMIRPQKPKEDKHRIELLKPWSITIDDLRRETKKQEHRDRMALLDS